MKLLQMLLIFMCIIPSKGMQAQEIPFTIAQNYFAKNTVMPGELVFSKITTQKEFEDLFGMATRMGKDGKPTNIDFSKQFVVAVIDSESNHKSTLDLVKVEKSNKKINLRYSKKQQNKAGSYTTRQVLIVLLDKKYATSDITVIKQEETVMVPFKQALNYFVRNSVPDELIEIPKITSLSEFEQYFGMATTMGENGKPTTIDFSKDFVVAVIAPPSGTIPSILFKSLEDAEDQLVLNYVLHPNPGTQFRHSMIIIISKDFEKDLKFQQF